MVFQGSGPARFAGDEFPKEQGRVLQEEQVNEL
jgi:hypothetical protein